jgi:hypothetical protein
MDEVALEALRRGSGIAVDADGVFTQQGRLVEHPRVQRLFHQGLSLREDGEVVLRVGPWWCYVTVARTAFFVASLRQVRGEDGVAEGGWEALLLGGRAVPLAGAVLGYAPDERLYLWAEGLSGPAVLLRQAHMQVMEALGASQEADRAFGATVREVGQVPQRGSPRPAAEVQAGLSTSR